MKNIWCISCVSQNEINNEAWKMLLSGVPMILLDRRQEEFSSDCTMVGTFKLQSIFCLHDNELRIRWRFEVCERGIKYCSNCLRQLWHAIFKLFVTKFSWDWVASYFSANCFFWDAAALELQIRFMVLYVAFELGMSSDKSCYDWWHSFLLKHSGTDEKCQGLKL